MVHPSHTSPPLCEFSNNIPLCVCSTLRVHWWALHMFLPWSYCDWCCLDRGLASVLASCNLRNFWCLLFLAEIRSWGLWREPGQENRAHRVLPEKWTIPLLRQQPSGAIHSPILVACFRGELPSWPTSQMASRAAQGFGIWTHTCCKASPGWSSQLLLPKPVGRWLELDCQGMPGDDPFLSSFGDSPCLLAEARASASRQTTQEVSLLQHHKGKPRCEPSPGSTTQDPAGHSSFQWC